MHPVVNCRVPAADALQSERRRPPIRRRSRLLFAIYAFVHVNGYRSGLFGLVL